MRAPPSTDRCPTCGNQLESTGECNICLLQLGISASGGAPPDDTSLPTPDELNAQFPQLEIKRLIGRGGMGAIYHARQTALDRDVALKLIAKEVSSDPAFVERFEREAKTLARLSHPNIVTIFDFGQTADGMAYLVLEYVDGINLREAIVSRSVGPDEALDIVSTICGALEYAHSKGIVHRDIKPENILLGENGTLKVADFGIAKIVDDSVPTPTLTASRQVLGTLHYLAPELMESPDQVDHRVDLYALGVVFYELLTGQLPLGRYDAPSKIQERADQRLDRIVMKTLNRRPQQRYQHASELDADLSAVGTSKHNDPPNDRSKGGNDGSPSGEARPSRASVPFTCEAMEGFAEVVGVAFVRDDVFHAEFRIRDAIVGQVKSKTHVVEIPRSQLTRLEIVRGFLGVKMIVTTDTISALGAFPNAETGQVELSVKRKDEGFARELAHALGFDSIQTVPRKADGGPLLWPDEPEEAKRMIFSLLMILCAMLNVTSLAALEYFFANQLVDVWLVAATTGTAVTIGPLAILQFVTGTLTLIGRARTLAVVTSIISMIPLSPAWIVSCPIGIWACWVFRRDERNDSPPPAKTNWGATTLMYIRESRWAKITGLLNVVAGIVFIAAVVAFKYGLYPVEMRYRVVESDTQYASLDRALESRLQISGGFRELDYDRKDGPKMVTVKLWQHSRDQVTDLLSVQSVPKLVWIELAAGANQEGLMDRPDNDQSGKVIPVVPGIKLSEFRTEEQSLGTAVHAVGKSIELTPDLVANVRSSGGESNQLIVELTSRGREQLAAADNEAEVGLALVIGDVVEGVAMKDSLSHKKILFQLSDASELTTEGIVAGIRGPSLPSQLELLD